MQVFSLRVRLPRCRTEYEFVSIGEALGETCVGSAVPAQRAREGDAASFFMRYFSLAAAIWASALAFLQPSAQAQGIPEPSITYYGVVKSTSGGLTRRLTYGTLKWTIQETAGAVPIVLTVPLTNINDQFCYVLRLPCETQLGTAAVSSGRLRLTTAGVSYNRSGVLVNGSVPAVIQAPAVGTAVYASKDRGRYERIDLVVNIDCIDSDGNTVCDDWEIAYFGSLGTNLGEDTDGDGMTNYQEYLADTNPLDPNSRFAIIDINTDPQGGVLIRFSTITDRTYTVLRSEDILGTYSPIATGVKATSNITQYKDATAVPGKVYFYRMLTE